MTLEVTCACQHCDGQIAFSQEMSGQRVACPHCGLDTVLLVAPPIIAYSEASRRVPFQAAVHRLFSGFGALLRKRKTSTPLIISGGHLAPGPSEQQDAPISEGSVAARQRNLPASTIQKKKLSFFGCTWDGAITTGQAADALAECAYRFPNAEAAWLKWLKRQSEIATHTAGLQESSGSDKITSTNNTKTTPPIEWPITVKRPSPGKSKLAERISPPPAARALPQLKKTTSLPSQIFALDMAKVNAITQETKEVAGLLSAVLQDEPEKAPPVPGTPASPLPEVLPLLRERVHRLSDASPMPVPVNQMTPPIATNPEQHEANLRFLDTIERLVNNGFRFKASQRDALAHLAIPDHAIYDDEAGTDKSSLAIAWALLKVGLHSDANGTLLPAEPVLIATLGGLISYQTIDDYKGLFGAAMPPVTRLNSQDTFVRLISQNHGMLKPGFYLSTYTELAVNKFQMMADFEGVAKEFSDEPPDNVIRAYTDFFAREWKPIEADTPQKAFQICRRLAKEGSPGIGEERTYPGIRWPVQCVYRPALADLVRHHFAAVVIEEGRHLKAKDSLIGRGLKILAPHYRLVLTGPSAKNRPAESPLLPEMPHDAIQTISHSPQVSRSRGHVERIPDGPPCPICGWSKCCCAGSAPDRVTTSLPARQKFNLDMSRVEAITKETEEVAGLLSGVMHDDPEELTALPKSPLIVVPELPQSPTGRGSARSPSVFAGLDAGFHPVLERLLTRDSWPPADFTALGREFHLMPLCIRDTLNEWADEALGDFILEGEDPVVVRRELMAKESI
jgi:hypothetical protein